MDTLILILRWVGSFVCCVTIYFIIKAIIGLIQEAKR